MLINCVTEKLVEGNGKVVWIIFVAFVPLIGGTIYFFVRRPTRLIVQEKR